MKKEQKTEKTYYLKVQNNQIAFELINPFSEISHTGCMLLNHSFYIFLTVLHEAGYKPAPGSLTVQELFPLS